MSQRPAWYSNQLRLCLTYLCSKVTPLTCHHFAFLLYLPSTTQISIHSYTRACHCMQNQTLNSSDCKRRKYLMWFGKLLKKVTGHLSGQQAWALQQINQQVYPQSIVGHWTCFNGRHLNGWAPINKSGKAKCWISSYPASWRKFQGFNDRESWGKREDHRKKEPFSVHSTWGTLFPTARSLNVYQVHTVFDMLPNHLVHRGDLNFSSQTFNNWGGGINCFCCSRIKGSMF